VSIVGVLTVSSSDDPRFTAGQVLPITIDPSVVVTATTTVEVSAPVAEPGPTASAAPTIDETATAAAPLATP